ncbi:hypothetical protein A2U01_0069689, partial [Trifolium medium]|nr:hypothetical protein [Trifolium medium]
MPNISETHLPLISLAGSTHPPARLHSRAGSDHHHAQTLPGARHPP